MEAEPGRTVSRATVAKLDKQQFSYGSVDFGQIAPMVGESELLHNEERMYLSKVCKWIMKLKNIYSHRYIHMCLLNSLAKNLILSVVGFYMKLYLSRSRYSLIVS